MFKSLNSKFSILLILFIILSVGIPTGFLVWQFRENFQQRSQILVSTTVNVIENCINQSMLSQDKKIPEIIKRYKMNAHIDHIRIYDNTGTINFSSQIQDINQKITDLNRDYIFSPADTIRKIEASYKENKYSIYEPILNKPMCQDCHVENKVIAYMNIESHFTPAEVRFFTGSFHILYLSIVLIIILYAGFYFFFRNFVNNPLKRLIKGISKIEKGNLETKIDVKGDTEFSLVAQNLNQLALRLKESKIEIEEMHFEQLQRADKMVTLGELAAEMAHEINNPAGVIMTRADYMELEAQDVPALRPYQDDIRVILSQLQRISSITANILKYSKKLPRLVQPINLGELVENSVRILQPRLEKKNITIQQSYTCNSSCEKPKILGDPQQIEQIVINLINNAIDSFDGAGNIKTTIKCLATGAIQLIISDNGKGMSEEVRAQIFSPFFTTKSAEKGTGLGLYIVKKICDNHHSEITCYSEVNKGTSFIITFIGEREQV